MRLGQDGSKRPALNGRQAGRRMRGHITKEKLKITAGAISAVVIVGWLAVFALALLWTP
jgi:hypothetical protein